MQTGGGDAASLQLQHPIFHQSHQRGDDHDKPTADQSRQLIAKRFPTAGGQHRQGISPSQNGFDDRTLTRPKTGPAEMLQERLFQKVQSTPDLVKES